MNTSPVDPKKSGLSNASKVLIGASLIAALIVGGVFVHAIAFWSCWDCNNPEAVASQEAAYATLVASYGGPPPADCSSAPVPVHEKVAGTIWDEGDVYVGQSPVWLGIRGFMTVENGRAVVHLVHSGIKKGADGFPIDLWWITNADFADVIHVRLNDTRSGTELSGEPATYMHDRDLLVPSETNSIAVGPTPPYRIFVTTVNAPTSPGCYVATASWPGGNWSITIALGK